MMDSYSDMFLTEAVGMCKIIKDYADGRLDGTDTIDEVMVHL